MYDGGVGPGDPEISSLGKILDGLPNVETYGTPVNLIVRAFGTPRENGA